VIALMLAVVLSIPYPQQPERGDIKPPDDCARYLGHACDNWKLAAWLPELNSGGHSTTVPFTDGFIIDGRLPQGPSFAGTQGSPTAGTPFTYGKAGPPRGVALYDAQHRIALYGQGCCSWHSAVLAAGVEPPPLAVEDRSLIAIRTKRGLYLGMTTQQALRLYGNALPETARGVPGVVVRAYRHPILFPPYSMPCQQDMDLGFYRDRLIYIGFTNAC
jgi:hypothetical protein